MSNLSNSKYLGTSWTRAWVKTNVETCSHMIWGNAHPFANCFDGICDQIIVRTGKYGPTYLVLDLLQKIFYTSDAARESFVELCEEEYVQKVGPA